MISVEKHHLKKWQRTKVKGRVPSSLVSAHRVDWTLDKPLPMDAILKIGLEAKKRRPDKNEPKPVGFWYVIPNRNRQREFHDKHVTLRVFPKSGRVFVLPGHAMAWPDLKGFVQTAFFMAGLDPEECERLSEQLVPQTKEKTFKIGNVDPFKVDHYRNSLGLTIGADGSHPNHLETREDWPTWIKPMLDGFTLQAEVNQELAKQIKLHLSVMAGINKTSEQLNKSTENLTKATSQLTKMLAQMKNLFGNRKTKVRRIKKKRRTKKN
jgi:hypothetical protein